MTPAALPHDGGVHAFIHAGQLHDEPPADLAAISCWADIDTDMDNLGGCYVPTPPAPLRRAMPAEACTELGAGTAPPRLGLLRRFHIACIERRLDIVRDEHARYTHLGAIGPVYHRNSLVMQLQLMARIRELRNAP